MMQGRASRSRRMVTSASPAWLLSSIFPFHGRVSALNRPMCDSMG